MGRRGEGRGGIGSFVVFTKDILCCMAVESIIEKKNDQISGKRETSKAGWYTQEAAAHPGSCSSPEPCGSGAPCCSFPVLRSASCVPRPVFLVSWIPRVLCSVFPSVLPLCSVSCVLCPLYCVPSCVPCFPQSAKGGHRDHGGQRGSLRNEHLPVRWGGGASFKNVPETSPLQTQDC